MKRKCFLLIGSAPKTGVTFVGRRKTAKHKTWWGMTPDGLFIGWLRQIREVIEIWMPTEWRPIKL